MHHLQARATSLLFATAQFARALGLGSHSILFHFAAGLGVINASFAVGSLSAAVALAAICCAPAEVKLARATYKSVPDGPWKTF